MEAKLLFTHALSPLHAGTGQGVGVIDLPIAREKATNLPYLPGSSLKGVLRDACPESDREKIFGPETTNAADYAGSVQFTDQRLLLMPIRSLTGTFAWVTSPLVLRRFLRDAGMAKTNPFAAVTVPQSPADDHCLVSAASKITGTDGKVTLEDLPLKADSNTDLGTWADELGRILFPDDKNWQEILEGRLCLVSDDTLAFLLETATEVVARIALEDETKTVKRGALWYEESLPAESVLSGLVIAAEVKAKPESVFNAISTIVARPLQFGGDATVGRGLCSLRMLG
ncbi:MAG: type III-B CRISPR module RAMP protein Cmr4 [Chloroflexota bacterium]